MKTAPNPFCTCGHTRVLHGSTRVCSQCDCNEFDLRPPVAIGRPFDQEAEVKP